MRTALIALAAAALLAALPAPAAAPTAGCGWATEEGD